MRLQRRITISNGAVVRVEPCRSTGQIPRDAGDIDSGVRIVRDEERIRPADPVERERHGITGSGNRRTGRIPHGVVVDVVVQDRGAGHSDVDRRDSIEAKFIAQDRAVGGRFATNVDGRGAAVREQAQPVPLVAGQGTGQVVNRHAAQVHETEAVANHIEVTGRTIRCFDVQAVETVCGEVVVDDPAAVWTRWREEVQRPRIGRQVQTMCAVVAKRVAKSHCGNHRWSRISRSNFGTTDDAVDHAATIGIELQAVVAVVHEAVALDDDIERGRSRVRHVESVVDVVVEVVVEDLCRCSGSHRAVQIGQHHAVQRVMNVVVVDCDPGVVGALNPVARRAAGDVEARDFDALSGIGRECHDIAAGAVEDVGQLSTRHKAGEKPETTGNHVGGELVLHGCSQQPLSIEQRQRSQCGTGVEIRVRVVCTRANVNDVRLLALG